MKKFMINLLGSLFSTIVILGFMFIVGFITPLSYIILGFWSFSIGKIILIVVFLVVWYIIFTAPDSMEEYIKQEKNK